MPNNAPAVAVIAADSPYTVVCVRGRLTPITAAAVSLSRMAISERPTRLLTIPRQTTYESTAMITASQYIHTAAPAPTIELTEDRPHGDVVVLEVVDARAPSVSQLELLPLTSCGNSTAETDRREGERRP